MTHGGVLSPTRTQRFKQSGWNEFEQIVCAGDGCRPSARSDGGRGIEADQRIARPGQTSLQAQAEAVTLEQDGDKRRADGVCSAVQAGTSTWQ